MGIVETGRFATMECSGCTESRLVLGSLRKTCGIGSDSNGEEPLALVGHGMPPSVFVLYQIFPNRRSLNT